MHLFRAGHFFAEITPGISYYVTRKWLFCRISLPFVFFFSFLVFFLFLFIIHLTREEMLSRRTGDINRSAAPLSLSLSLLISSDG
jgi:hypothetical protein